jgi:lipoprotein-anchoring transpeptidase ErfK/SrfK
MLRRRVSLAVLCAACVVFTENAFAQNCERFLWQCQGYSGPSGQPSAPAPSFASPDFDSGFGHQGTATYAALGGDKFPVPAVDLSTIDHAFLRQTISYITSEPAGTVIIDTHSHYLYLVEGNGQAIRYGVGVGREGFGWSGVATIHDKQEWPDWYPPKEMIERQPEIKRQMSELQSGIGMHGGPRNPLGARAMYLWQDNKDTLFRIHGTIEPWTIGKNVSSGCIRMINQDAIDLYQRVAVGAKVIVR